MLSLALVLLDLRYINNLMILYVVVLLQIIIIFGKQVAEGARLRGAANIIGVDLNPDKFEIGSVRLF